MKKTVATLLVLALVASLCGMMFVSADESTNLALGKEMKTPTVKNWGTNLTDGVATASLDDAKWEGDDRLFFGLCADNTEKVMDGETENLTGTFEVDLGEVCSVEKVRIYMAQGYNVNGWGIITPKSITVLGSTDGENYTELSTVSYERPTEDAENKLDWVELAGESAANARYVRIEIVINPAWCFLNEIEVIGTVASGDTSDESSNESSDETPDDSAVDTSSEAVSEESKTVSEESKPVSAGDTGVLVFAVLGVVAIAGVAVAVKVRH